MRIPGNRGYSTLALTAMLMLTGCGKVVKNNFNSSHYSYLVPKEKDNKNLIAQGDFESDFSFYGHASPWRCTIFKPAQKVPFSFDKEFKVFGSQSGKVIIPSDLKVHLRALHQWVKPGHTYTFSAYIKTKNIDEVKIRVSTFVDQPDGRWKTHWQYAYKILKRKELDKTKGFRRISCTLKVPEKSYSIQPAITIEGKGGILWIDGVQFEESGKPTEFAVSARERQLVALVNNNTFIHSGETSPEKVFWSPVRAFDNNPYTYWFTDAATKEKPQYIGVIFKKEREVEALKVNYFIHNQRPARAGTKLQIFDGEKWRGADFYIHDYDRMRSSSVEYIFYEKHKIKGIKLVAEVMRPFKEDDEQRIAINDILFR
ncbi:MAG: hypothetical protein ACYTFY_21090 [Planctomycetota bacterium]